MNTVPKKQLRFLDMVMIVISMVIGIGIFRNPSIVAKSAGNELIFYLAWIIGGIITIFGALIFAELGSRVPLTGGYYKTFSLSYPSSLAFTLTWGYLALNAAAASAVAFAGAQYVSLVLPEIWHTITGTRMLFFFIVIFLFILNFIGLRSGTITQNILSGIKIGLMLIFCSAIFFSDPTNIKTEGLTSSGHHFLYAVGTSLIAVFFTYGGYQNTTNFGSEVFNPQKNISCSIVTGVSIVILCYLAINFVYVKSLGFAGVQQSPLIASDLTSIIFGSAGARVASLAIFISILGWLNASFLFNPRVICAMSTDKMLPGIFSRTNEKRQVHEFALIVYTSLVILFFLILQSYENLLNYVMFNDTVVLAFAANCIFLVRRKQMHSGYSGFRIKWFPLIPIAFIVVILAVTLHVILEDPKSALIGTLVLILGFPLYFFFRIFTKNNNEPLRDHQ